MGEGYVIPERTVEIVWDEGEYVGATATVRMSNAVAIFDELSDLLGTHDGETYSEKRARLDRINALLAEDIVVEWNLQDHRGPIPITPAGMLRLPAELRGELIAQYRRVVVGVPFGRPRPSGEPSEEASPQSSTDEPSATDGSSTAASSPAKSPTSQPTASSVPST